MLQIPQSEHQFSPLFLLRFKYFTYFCCLFPSGMSKLALRKDFQLQSTEKNFLQQIYWLNSMRLEEDMALEGVIWWRIDLWE